MRNNTIAALLALAVVIILGAYGFAAYKPSPIESGVVLNVEDSAVRAQVEAFGSTLQQVSLLAPDAGTQIQTQYAGFVTPELLAQWAATPEAAPGRKTSSPWPDKITVVSVTQAGLGVYTVEANVIEAANGPSGKAPVAVYPVTMRVENRGGAWLIASWRTGAYSELPKEMIVTGLWECLPHKDQSGPQTTECAFGVAVDQSDGHYAIDTSLMSQYPVDFPTGTHVQVRGVVTPANQLNSIQKYDIDGIIQATSITKL